MAELSADQVAAWTTYNDTQWGRLRLDLLWAVLERHLLRPPARVLDVGCGLAELALRFSRAGSEVVAADASTAMLAEAENRAGRTSVRWLAADLDGTAAALHAERFDLVLCHNVLGYVPDPAAACAALARLLTDGGLLSITAGNRLADPLRAAWMRRDLDAAVAAAESGVRSRVGNTLGVEYAVHDPDQATTWLTAAGLEVAAFAGTRIVNDYLADELKTDANYDAILRLELALCERDPYRRVAPFLQLLGRRTESS